MDQFTSLLAAKLIHPAGLSKSARMSSTKPRGEMSFLDHLEELRWAILKCVLAILVGMIVCFVFSEQILNFLVEPTRLESLGIELQSFKPAGMFTIKINVSLVTGFALTLPYILFQLWHFISPGLLQNEKKFVPYVIMFSCLLFVLGAAFAFYVLIPVMISFFIDIYIPGVKAIWDIGFYIGLVNKMVLLMGAVFQMPMIVGFLTWIRVLSYDFLIGSWRYAMVIIFIAAAVITPTGDPYTQTLVAIPLVVLFFISLGISRLIGGGREKASEDDDENDSTSDQDFEQPTDPDPPTIPRGKSPYMGPESGMDYWPEDDDEFIYDYDNEIEEDKTDSPSDENKEGEDTTETESEVDEGSTSDEGTTGDTSSAESTSKQSPKADEDRIDDESDENKNNEKEDTGDESDENKNNEKEDTGDDELNTSDPRN